MTNYVGKGLGNYELLELLGQGAFADVYLGKHRYLQSQAALKVLRTRLDDADEQKFLSEARILGYLRHPHIVRVLDFAVEQGTPVLIMEYAPRGTLRKHYPSGMQLPLATVVEFVLQIASALQYAHNHQVIHRDVKPENILLDADHHLLISDFGLSLLSPTPDLLSTQEPAGTFPYTAPEQLRGKPCFASDQYSLAIIAYEWLCGKRPFSGNALELMYHHLSAAPPPLHNYCSTLSSNVEAVILRALAKDPADRFVSIQAFAQALARASQQQLVEDEESQVTSPFKTVMSCSPDASYTTLPVPVVSSTPNASTARSKSTTKNSKKPSNRHRLLSKVRSYWIKGILEQSLYDLGLIALGLQPQAEAVVNPWRLVLQQPGLTPQRLPASTHIVQAYDDADGALLILGEPGSGKTTLLLELARDLLHRAEYDETHPMPVIFNLSSWSVKQAPITTWLVEELNSKYQVPRKMAKAWVTNNQVLPLLDGFDEVVLNARSACLDAINAYRKEHGLFPTVVCSRSADYFALESSILLSSAVMVQPLTEQQVDDYLASGGEATQTLRVALHQYPILRELTTTPLMLSIFMLTYHGIPVEDLLREASLTDRQRKVFEQYVACMLKRRGVNTTYTPQETTHWLSELAKQLVQHNQSMFYIERMQPDWLPEGRRQHSYVRLAVGIVFGLLTALCFGPLGGMLLTTLWSKVYGVHLSFVILLGSMLVIGVWLGVLVGSLNGLLYTRDRERRTWGRLARRVAQAILNGSLVGVFLGCPYGVISYLNTHDVVMIVGYGLIIGLLGGGVYMLIDLVLAIQVAEIRPAETFVWSWAKMVLNLLKFVCFSLLGTLLIGLLISGFYEVMVMRTLSMIVTLQDTKQFVYACAPLFVIVGGLLGGIAGGLSGNTLDARNFITPNQGIIRSAHRGLLVGVVMGLLGGILGAVLGSLVAAGDSQTLLSFMLTYALLFGGPLGLTSGLGAGGMACIQHFALRFLQWDAGAIPWNYPRFLNYAAERILLRKVGGGYMFTHRLLLEYLAAQNS